MDLGRAIYKILNDNTAITDMVASRISPNVMKQTNAFPFIVYDVSSVEPISQKDSVATLDSVDIMISGYTSNYKDSSKLANYIRTALDRVSGNYNGVNIQAIDFEGYDDIFDDDSGADGIYRKSLNFTARIINDINNIYSLDFDGVDDYVAINGISSVIDTDLGSISLWAKIDTTTSSGHCFNSFIDSNNNLKFFYHAGDNEFRFTYRGGGSSKVINITDAIEGDGKWHHLLATWDKTGDAISIYLDGALKDSTGSLPTISGTVAAASIGNNAEGGAYFLGNIDEVSLWNSELTAAQVLDIYNDGYPKGVGGTSLIGWWKMGDGNNDGTTMAEYPTIPDNSANNNNGTMTNMAEADIVADVPDGT